MSNRTEKLSLFKWDITDSSDLNSAFDIETSLNENWDSIDSFASEINSDLEEKSEQIQMTEEDIEDLMNNQITGTATGTSIDLNDSATCKVRSIKLIGNSEQNGEPTLENPVAIENTGDSGNINEKIVNKNYINVTATSETKNGVTFTVNKDKSITINGTASSNVYFRLSDNFTLPAGTYTLSNHNSNARPSVDFGFYDDNYNFRAVETETNTFDSEVTIKPHVRVISGKTVDNQTIYPSIEGGATVTEYQAHKEQNVSFPMANGQLLREGDYLSDDGIHHVRKQINLASQTIANRISFGNYYRYQINVSDAKIYSTNDGSTAISNFFNRDVNALNSANAEPGMFAQYRSTNQFYFISDKSTNAEFIAQLSANNAVLEYDSITETVEAYTEEQQTAWNKIKSLKTYKPTTHIYSEDETPATIDITYVKDIETIINEISSAIVAQGGV